MLCVSACPARDALALAAPRGRTLPPWAIAAAIAVTFFGFVGYARITGHWTPHIPDAVYLELVARASDFGHP